MTSPRAPDRARARGGGSSRLRARRVLSSRRTAVVIADGGIRLAAPFPTPTSWPGAGPRSRAAPDRHWFATAARRTGRSPAFWSCRCSSLSDLAGDSERMRFRRAPPGDAGTVGGRPRASGRQLLARAASPEKLTGNKSHRVRLNCRAAAASKLPTRSCSSYAGLLSVVATPTHRDGDLPRGCAHCNNLCVFPERPFRRPYSRRSATS